MKGCNDENNRVSHRDSVGYSVLDGDIAIFILLFQIFGDRVENSAFLWIRNY